MNLFERVSKDLLDTMKSKEEGRETRLSVLRMMKSALKNAEIAKRGGDSGLSEDDAVGVLTSMVKQRRESAEQFENAGRRELAAKEDQEIEIIREYLPQQMSAEEIGNVIRATIAETGASGVKDMGKLMKALMPKVKGKADGKVVNEQVKAILEQS